MTASFVDLAHTTTARRSGLDPTPTRRNIDRDLVRHVVALSKCAAAFTKDPWRHAVIRPKPAKDSARAGSLPELPDCQDCLILPPEGRGQLNTVTGPLCWLECLLVRCSLQTICPVACCPQAICSLCRAIWWMYTYAKWSPLVDLTLPAPFC